MGHLHSVMLCINIQSGSLLRKISCFGQDFVSSYIAADMIMIYKTDENGMSFTTTDPASQREMISLISLSIKIPEELMEELRTLKETRYPNKSISEVCRLMIWRGMEQTSIIWEERGR